MSQIERKWITDGAINNAKIDNGDSYVVYRLDATNAISVNTNNPQSQVHVVGTSAPATLRLESLGGVGRPYVLDSNTSGRFNISDSSAGNTRLTIDGTGQVGIGTTMPQVELQVVGPSTDSRLALGSSASQYVINSDGVSGNLVMAKTFGTGSFAINSAGAIVGDATVTGDWQVGGDSTIAGGLEVIGTTTIVNTEGITSDKLVVTHTGPDTTSILVNNASIGPAFYANNTSSGPAFVSNQGNVGLGTTTPVYPLHVYGSTNGAIAAVMQNASAGTGAQSGLAIRNNLSEDGSIISFSSAHAGSIYGGIPNADQAMFSSNHGGGMLINEINPSPMFFATTNAVRMTITAAGSVGIGISTPQTALAVSGSTSASSRVHAVDTLGVPISVGQPVKAVFMGMNGSPLYGEINAYDYGANSPLALTLQRSGGNVGIGSTQPTYLLDVAGTERVSGVLTVTSGAGFPGSVGVAGASAVVYGNPSPILRVVDFNRGVDLGLNGASHAYVEAKGGNDLFFTTSTVERVRINSSGLVGIGTTNPSQIVHINSTSPNHSAIQFAIGGTTYGYYGAAGSTNGLIVGSAVGDTCIRSDGARILFGNAGASFVTINNSGNVGIGTTNPSALLQVQGTFQLSATQPVSGISTATNLGGGSASNSNLSTQLAIKTYVDTQVAGSSPFTRTAPNIYPVIITDNVGIGTTNPLYQLHVVGSPASIMSDCQTALNAQAQIVARNNITYDIGIFSFSSTNSNTYGGFANNNNLGAIIDTHPAGLLIDAFGSAPIYLATSNTVRMTIEQTFGNVGIGTKAPDNILNVASVGVSTVAIDTYNSTTGSFANNLLFRQSKSSSMTHVATDAGQVLGTLTFCGSTNVTWTGPLAVIGVTQTGPASSLGAAITFSTGFNNVAPAERMRVVGAGQVGIGTTNPLVPLQISTRSTGLPTVLSLATNDFVSTTTGSRMLFALGALTGDTYSSIQAQNTGGSGNDNLILQFGGGNVGIGSTTSPNSLLEVIGTIRSAGASNGLAMRNVGNSMFISTPGTGPGGTDLLITSVNTGNALYIMSPSFGVPAVGIGATTPSSTLQVFGSFAGRIKKLDPTYFNLISTNFVAFIGVGLDVDPAFTHYNIDMSTASSAHPYHLVLPQASTCQGRMYTIKLIVGGPPFTLSIDAYNGPGSYSDDIEGATTLAMSGPVFKSRTLYSDGLSRWYIQSAVS